ncbi:hypothetical protein ACNQGP_15030 [Flavobacterium sp. GT2N3]|uniref:hypothetical protein n=1 Tax=unclassified Flavobacterium TaxID=196869 RepID=UPI003AAFD555
MNLKKTVFFVQILLFAFVCIYAQERTTIKLNNEWKFFKFSSEKDFENHFNDAKWQTVSVLRDWTIYGSCDKEIDKQTAATPTRPVTVGMDQVKATMESRFGVLRNIPGLYYRIHLYKKAFKKFPQGFILGSETASKVSSCGVYKFPVVKAVSKQCPDFQTSSYDLEYCSWSNLPDNDKKIKRG